MKTAELKGQATPQQIADWKSKHGKVFEVVVDGHVCYLKKCDRKTLSAATSVGSKDPIKFNEILLKNCWLGGSDEIQTDDELFLSVGAVLAEIINVKSAEIKNL